MSIILDKLRIITPKPRKLFQQTIGVFFIALVMSVIDKLTEFLSRLMMKYELQYRCWI